jgi:hypothetical protein
MQLFKMLNLIILLPSVAKHKPKEQWQTPIRSVVRFMQHAGKSYSKIKK